VVVDCSSKHSNERKLCFVLVVTGVADVLLAFIFAHIATCFFCGVIIYTLYWIILATAISVVIYTRFTLVARTTFSTVCFEKVDMSLRVRVVTIESFGSTEFVLTGYGVLLS